MRVDNTRAVKSYISGMIHTKDINTKIQRDLSVLFTNGISLNLSENITENYLTQFKSVIQSAGIAADNEQIKVAAILTGLLKDDVTEAFSEIEYYEFIKTAITSAKQLISSEYRNNVFLSNVQFSGTKMDSFTIGNEKYLPNEIFIYADANITPSGVIVPSAALFDAETDIPVLKENGNIISSLSPYDITKYEAYAKDAYGKVLCIGCGLGYYAYIVSCMENVESVTIVEDSPEIAELFRNAILPQFECKDKITIITGNSLEFLRNVSAGEYCTCFIDNISGDIDFDTYLAYKTASNNLKKITVTIKGEKNIARNLSSYVYSTILVSAYKQWGISSTSPEFDELGQHLQEYVKELTKKEVVHSPADIKRLLSPEYLIKLLSSKKAVYESLAGETGL